MWNLVAIRGGVAIDEDYTTSQISNCKINHSASAKNQLKYSYARRPAFRSLAKKTLQSALAERVGCLLATIEKIESEERRPSTQIAELLANALEIPTAERKLFLKVARRLKADDGLASVSPIVSPPVKTNIPIPPTPLIGRDDELGGIGKTRLGIEFANRQCGLFPDGVHYVPLASVNSAGSIVPAIADAFAFLFSGPIDPKEQLSDHLAHTIQKSALLVWIISNIGWCNRPRQLNWWRRFSNASPPCPQRVG